VASRIQSAPELIMTDNAVYLLESLLRRYLYSEPFQLKRDRELREAVVSILDCLVNAGSSVAYRMRDDFVTPVSISTAAG